ncbi:MAG: hypothetical protein H5T69_03010, partial [Chloroflexi bacterium]|nr:hypothetical protein [Chloroflexota bacterium]
RAGARWTSDARAKLYVFELPNVEAAVSVGNQQEILQAEYGIQLVAPTTVAVSGDGAAARAADLAHAMHQGLDIPRCIVEHRATSSALAVRVRNRAQDLAGLRWRADRILVHLRPELQVWDRITLSSPCPAAGVDSARILTAIRESYDAQRGEYVSELELGEAIPE